MPSQTEVEDKYRVRQKYCRSPAIHTGYLQYGLLLSYIHKGTVHADYRVGWKYPAPTLSFSCRCHTRVSCMTRIGVYQKCTLYNPYLQYILQIYCTSVWADTSSITPGNLIWHYYGGSCKLTVVPDIVEVWHYYDPCPVYPEQHWLEFEYCKGHMANHVSTSQNPKIQNTLLVVQHEFQTKLYKFGAGGVKTWACWTLRICCVTPDDPVGPVYTPNIHMGQAESRMWHSIHSRFEICHHWHGHQVL